MELEDGRYVLSFFSLPRARGRVGLKKSTAHLETTKHPLRRGITGCGRFLKQHLVSGAEIVKARWASIRHR
jgi:hypothetical protein